MHAAIVHKKIRQENIWGSHKHNLANRNFYSTGALERDILVNILCEYGRLTPHRHDQAQSKHFLEGQWMHSAWTTKNINDPVASCECNA